MRAVILLFCFFFNFWQITNAQQPKLMLPIGHAENVVTATFSTDGKYIVTASWDKTAKVWNAVSGQLVSNLVGHTKGLYNASFSPDGKYIVTASNDNTAKVWNAVNGQLVSNLVGH